MLLGLIFICYGELIFVSLFGYVVVLYRGILIPIPKYMYVHTYIQRRILTQTHMYVRNYVSMYICMSCVRIYMCLCGNKTYSW